MKYILIISLIFLTSCVTTQHLTYDGLFYEDAAWQINKISEVAMIYRENGGECDMNLIEWNSYVPQNIREQIHVAACNAQENWYGE